MMIAQRILVLSRTATLTRQVQAAAGSGCAVTAHDRITDLDDYLAANGPFDLVVAGPLADSRSALARLARLHEDHPGTALLLALPANPKASMSDIIRAGAVDLLEVPAEPRTMRAVIRRALATRVAPVVTVIDGTEGEERPLAEVLTVASPSGGCGKTFYSTNLAHFLHRTTDQRVCLVDLDLQFGEVTSALRVRPRYTMTDAVTRTDAEDGDLDEQIEEYLVTHPAGFWILPAPRNPAEADQIGPPDVTRVVRALRRHFDYLVLDTSAQLSEIVLAAMDQSTRLICMATLDLPSIRNMRVFIETLDKLKVPTDSVSVILNKVEPDMGIRVEEANEALHQKVVSVLPYAREVTRSINEGTPVLVSAPKAGISQQLAEGMQRQLGHLLPGAPASDAPVRPVEHRSRRRRKPQGGSSESAVLAGLRRMVPWLRPRPVEEPAA